MKILLCGDSLSVGGAETHILLLARGLAGLGHSVTVAAEYGELCPALFASEGNISFVRIPFGRKSAGNIVSLRRLIVRGKFDVVHAHSRPSALAVSLVRASLPKVKFGFAVTAHACYESSPIKNRLTVWGDATVAVSDDIKKRITSLLGASADRVTVIPNGIDTEAFSPKQPNNVPNGTFNILFASRLDSDCSLGASLLCELAVGLSEVIEGLSITVAGGGSELSRIKKLADRANKTVGRRCIRAVGAVLDMPRLIAECDLAVGVSRFALEAMAMEKNVILFGNEGALGLFEHSRLWDAERTNFTARGCGNLSREFLFGEIMRLCRMDPRKRRELGKLGRETVLCRHSAEVTVRDTLRVYSSVLPRPKILIGGYYGFGNLGDETVGAILSDELKKRIPRSEVGLLSPRLRRSPRALVGALARSDVYISGGGSLLQSATSLRSLCYYSGLIALAKALGCRVITAANGLGPLRTAPSRAIAARALLNSDYISMRDPKSKSLAECLTRHRKKVFLSADPAFSCRFSGAANGRIEWCGAVSLRHGEADGQVMGAALARLFDSMVFLPMDGRFDAADMHPRDARELTKMMGRCSAAVGSRLHFLIFAILLGLPFAPIGTDPKINSLSLEVLGLPSIDPSGFCSAERLAREIERYLGLSAAIDLEAFVNKKRALFGKDAERIAGMIGRGNAHLQMYNEVRLNLKAPSGRELSPKATEGEGEKMN